MVMYCFRHFKKPLDIVAEFIPQACVVDNQYSAESLQLNIIMFGENFACLGFSHK